MIDFLSLVNNSLSWTKTVLFKPFNLKKWLILGFVALLSGTLSSGSFNLNLPSPKSKAKEARTYSSSPARAQGASSAKIADKQPSSDVKATIIQIRDALRQPGAVPLVILGAVLVLLALGLMSWLFARFSFVFLDDVLKNDASVRAPFNATKELGDSLFACAFSLSILFTALFGSLGFFLIRTILRLTIFSRGIAAPFSQVLLASLPYAAAILLLALFSAILWLFISDIVLVVMYKDNAKFAAAFPAALKIISANKKNFLAYILVKLVLRIAAAVIYMFISLASLVVLIIPVILVAGLVYLISLLSHIAAAVFLVAVVLPAGLCLAYCLLCLGLPVSVFFRTLSIKFVGRLDQKYNLFSSQDEVLSKPQAHSPELAATLSFVVAGLGQLYNGQAAKGILIFLTSWLIFPWIIGIIDAYNTAKKLKAAQAPVKKRIGCMVVFVAGIFILLAVFFIMTLLAAIAIPNLMQARAKAETKKTAVETERR